MGVRRAHPELWEEPQSLQEELTVAGQLWGLSSGWKEHIRKLSNSTIVQLSAPTEYFNLEGKKKSV